MFRFFFLLLLFFVQKGKTRANSHTILHLAFSNIHNIININSIVLTLNLIHNVDSTQWFFNFIISPIKTIELKIFCLTLVTASGFVFLFHHENNIPSYKNKSHGKPHFRIDLENVYNPNSRSSSSLLLKLIYRLCCQFDLRQLLQNKKKRNENISDDSIWKAERKILSIKYNDKMIEFIERIV